MEVSYEVKHPLGNSFQVQLGGSFLEGFTCYLEQLFCRKPISAHSWRKELHRGCCFRIFKNKQDKNGKNKKCTIFGNLRTITQEGKKETRQMTPFLFFLSTFWAVCDNHFFVFENCQNSFSWGPPLVHAALQNTWILKLKAWDQNFVPFSSIHIQVLLFLSVLKTTFVWSHGLQVWNLCYAFLLFTFLHLMCWNYFKNILMNVFHRWHFSGKNRNSDIVYFLIFSPIFSFPD